MDCPILFQHRLLHNQRMHIYTPLLCILLLQLLNQKPQQYSRLKLLRHLLQSNQIFHWTMNLQQLSDTDQIHGGSCFDCPFWCTSFHRTPAINELYFCTFLPCSFGCGRLEDCSFLVDPMHKLDKDNQQEFKWILKSQFLDQRYVML